MLIYPRHLKLRYTLSVGLSDSLNLVLLLNGVRVGALLGAVHDLVSETLGSGLYVSESTVSSTNSDQGQSLVDTSKGRDINRLSSNNTSGPNSGGILSRSAVLDGINQNLNRVLVGQQVNNLKRLLDDTNGELLLTVVSSLHHHGVNQSLDNRTSGLSEPLLLITTSSVWKVHGGGVLEGDVILRKTG